MEWGELINTLCTSKATGLDGISARLLKAAAPVISQSLTNLFNEIILSGQFLFDWKNARVTPLHKNGPRNFLDNYRPISVLPVVLQGV